MKKIILWTAFGIAGLVSAKNVEKSKPTKEKQETVQESECSESEVFRMRCFEYSMWIPCQDFFINDQVCWGEGTGVPTWDDAWNCMNENVEMAIFHFCGG
ncbi:hypothetical protein SD427_13120 [Chryseobacterium sp. JJR-5R]|uniref:hypothetical protein n=1 Tax=Chryseobacterium sp. JJR-5R TaxID=3093923 RepID=UPI002A762849|nr:hypothetical protein [Chryseobacterium sp. JJR-5R]WPO81706.1 hypothetical protein SD427_13120 [Chryseobacterium sp. JJR-5R]